MAGKDGLSCIIDNGETGLRLTSLGVFTELIMGEMSMNLERFSFCTRRASCSDGAATGWESRVVGRLPPTCKKSPADRRSASTWVKDSGSTSDCSSDFCCGEVFFGVSSVRRLTLLPIESLVEGSSLKELSFKELSRKESVFHISGIADSGCRFFNLFTLGSGSRTGIVLSCFSGLD